MGWASGSGVAYRMINVIYEHVKNDRVRLEIYREMIEALEDQDCDTLCECVGIDPVYDSFFPEDEEDE